MPRPSLRHLSPDSGSASGRFDLRRFGPIALLLVAGAGGYWFLGDALSMEWLRENRSHLLALREAHGLAFAAAFFAVYALIVALSLPGAAVASVSGGFLFGLTAGTALNVGAASLGAVAVFCAARWGPGAWIDRHLTAQQGQLERLRAGVRANAVSVLLMLRLMPVVPFFLANLLPALAGVSLRVFAATTVVGILPGALAFTWMGVGLGRALDGDPGAQGEVSLFAHPSVLAPIAVLGALSLLPVLVRWRRGWGVVS